MGRLRSVSRETLLLPIHAWRSISRLLPPRCRYHPSCSRYCLDAVRRHGVLVGPVLAGWRVLRCNPWSHGGIDAVPDHPADAFRRGDLPHRRPR